MSKKGAKEPKKLDFGGIKWKTIGRSSAHKWTEKGEKLQGFYLGFEVVKINKRDTRLHLIQTDEDTTVRVWDSRVLQGLGDLKKGTPVRIEYLGKVKKGNRAYHNFNVEAGQ